MEFRNRDYVAEAKIHSLTRSNADSHPLSASYPSFQVEIIDDEKNDIADPLRALSCNVAHPFEDFPDVHNASTSALSNDDATQILAKDWTTFKRLLMQRFPSSKMVSISSIAAALLKSGKTHEKSSGIHVDELDDPEGSAEQDVKLISRTEYISRLSELKNEVGHAWHTDDRITSLKLSIKVARLLMDTTVLQFYPTSFSLATDILDMLGDMVWERIKQKVEFQEDGTQLCSLPEDFQASDICSDAKETCFNWFCKIGSIRELLPRIYLELAILPCWRFLVDRPADVLHRLVLMMRGLADPLASAYCHLYMAHRAQKLLSSDKGYLITCIIEINAMMKPIISPKEATDERSLKSKQIRVSLVEPAIEYILKCIFKDPQQQVSNILVELGLGQNPSELLGRSLFISVIVHHLLKELPVEVISGNAVNILRHIEFSNDSSFDQCMNFRLFGFRLSERKCSEDVVHAILDMLIQFISQYTNLEEYLRVVDGYVDIVLQNQMKTHLQVILEGIATRACKKWMADSELENLQSIFLKILSHLNCIEDALELDHFIDILDVMRGKSRNNISMHILDMATRNDYISHPTTIQFLSEVAQGLHDVTNSLNMMDEDNQRLRHLLSRFIQMVDYGTAMEHNLAFLVESRGAFAFADELKETLVHSGNRLAIKAMKDAKVQLSFVRSCLAFCEVTIPSISSGIKQLNLYLETAEVALACGLVCHSDGLIDSALSSLRSLALSSDSQRRIDTDCIISAVQKLCSLLVIVPGNPKFGVAGIPKSLLSLANSPSSITPRLRAKISFAIALMSSALSQNKLPYHASSTEVFGNDLLFFGDSSYRQELVSLSHCILQNMLDVIQQESSQVVRGNLALEACNCIASTLPMNNETLPICAKLMDLARSCLSADNAYLQSTSKFLDSWSWISTTTAATTTGCYQAHPDFSQPV
ncbi:hypothetical protein Nepgr_007597 [Nepenthes gracilis]|uniref:Uncharacterized protein n=1 Tax=Nepenthes gracilis TaxID=150966 RepID=A0AAD3XIE2_NEPGR|nr:hypothetical protein Nepgr_007597 [Nepenthes gracilis]